MIDSSVIMEYLEQVFADGRTFVPTEPVERARMRALVRFIDELAFLPHFQSMSEEAFLRERLGR